MSKCVQDFKGVREYIAKSEEGKLALQSLKALGKTEVGKIDLPSDNVIETIVSGVLAFNSENEKVMSYKFSGLKNIFSVLKINIPLAR